MHRKRQGRIFKYLNPKDLAKEVHVYGYDFSWKLHIRILLCSLLGISGIGVIYKLESVYFVTVIVILLIILPTLILNSYKRMYEQKRFADASLYIEQMLYSFQKSGKVTSALKETRELFEEGKMRGAIDEAVTYLETGIAKTNKGTLWEALTIIEKEYTCRKVHMVHKLLINSEEFGGDASDSILVLLNDIEIWKRRCYKLQADKKLSHADNIISIVVATILCAVALYVLNTMGTLFKGVADVNIFSNKIIQLSSFVFILFMIWVFAKSVKSMTDDWLQSEGLQNEKYILDCYHLVTGCGKGKTSGKKVLGYRIARRDVNEELYLVLPQWLMEMALLLQENNVQVSIGKSITDAPAILQIELERLLHRLKEDPDKLRSYTDFCRDFDIPEAQSAMKMLHAIAESGTGNVKIQIHNLIVRVQEMQNIADEIRSKRILFQMKMIFSYPVFAVTCKLMLDLSIGMLYMLKLLGDIGGV